MSTELTLTLDEAVLERAQRFAERTGKSLSKLVTEYLAVVSRDDLPALPASPLVRSLVGAFGREPVDEEEYHRYLEEKYL